VAIEILRVFIDIRTFFKVWPWWSSRHFERPQLFNLNTVARVVMKRDFSAFCRWLCREVLYFERPLEKFQGPFRSLKTLLKTVDMRIQFLLCLQNSVIASLTDHELPPVIVCELSFALWSNNCVSLNLSLQTRISSESSDLQNKFLHEFYYQNGRVTLSV